MYFGLRVEMDDSQIVLMLGFLNPILTKEHKTTYLLKKVLHRASIGGVPWTSNMILKAQVPCFMEQSIKDTFTTMYLLNIENNQNIKILLEIHRPVGRLGSHYDVVIYGNITIW